MADDKKKEEAVFLPTTAALDLERRVDEEEMTPKELAEKYEVEARDFTGDGNDTSAYVGVNPEYMNYANETEKPLRSGADSAVGKVEDAMFDSAAVAEAVEGTSNQTDGGGSSVPLVYATLSGSDYENRLITVDEAKKEAVRLAPDELKETVEAQPVVAAPVKSTTSKTAAK